MWFPPQCPCSAVVKEDALCCTVKLEMWASPQLPLRCHLLCSEAGGVDVADLHREWRTAIHQMGFSSKAATKCETLQGSHDESASLPAWAVALCWFIIELLSAAATGRAAASRDMS